MQPNNINYDSAEGYNPFAEQQSQVPDNAHSYGSDTVVEHVEDPNVGSFYEESGSAPMLQNQQPEPVIQQDQAIQMPPPQPKKFLHPVAVSGLLTYLFLSLFYSNFIMIFIICILLVTFDFWAVKNITGRLLVGLRWWNEILPDGKNKWRFESTPDKSKLNQAESIVFWGCLFLTPAIWAIFAVTSILKLNFDWLLIVVVAIILSGANIVGYLKCAKDARKKLKNMAIQYGAKAAVNEGMKNAFGGDQV